VRQVRGYLTRAAFNHRSPQEMTAHVLERWGPTGVTVAMDFLEELENLVPQLNRAGRRKKRR